MTFTVVFFVSALYELHLYEASVYRIKVTMNPQVLLIKTDKFLLVLQQKSPLSLVLGSDWIESASIELFHCAWVRRKNILAYKSLVSGRIEAPLVRPEHNFTVRLV